MATREEAALLKAAGFEPWPGRWVKRVAGRSYCVERRAESDVAPPRWVAYSGSWASPEFDDVRATLAFAEVEQWGGLRTLTGRLDVVLDGDERVTIVDSVTVPIGEQYRVEVPTARLVGHRVTGAWIDTYPVPMRAPGPTIAEGDRLHLDVFVEE